MISLFFCELRERNLAHQNQEASKSRDPQNTLTTDALCQSLKIFVFVEKTTINLGLGKLNEQKYLVICLKKKP